MNSSEKLALFVDGQNLHFTAKGLGFDIDFKRFLAEFETRGALVRAYYYTTIAEDAEFHTIRPLIDWLDYNGFTVRARPVTELNDGEGRRKFKRNIAVELAIDALEIAKYVDQIVLFSGDGDFCSLVAAIQAAVLASRSYQAFERSPRWLLTNCVGRRTHSSSWTTLRLR
jgi:uncharacterized LabA/DUF88 family protein